MDDPSKKRKKSDGNKDGKSRSVSKSERPNRSGDANIPISGKLPVSSPPSFVRSEAQRTKGKRKQPRKSAIENFFIWLGRVMVLAMISIAPWCFGAVSQAAQSWLFVLAIIGLAAWWFAMVFGNRFKSAFPLLAIPVILGLVIVGLQMLPLNEATAQFLAPRQLELYETYSSTAPDELLVNKQDPISVDARISMDIDGTAKMFNLLTLSLTCLILGCNLFSSRRFIYLLPLAMMLNGVLISLYGISQQLRGDLTIYGFVFDQIVQPIGPFVNRNNAAGFLLICLAGSIAVLYGAFHGTTKSGARPRLIITKEYPIWKRMGLQLGIFFAELNAKKILAMMGTFIIVIGILFSFSRGGILALGIGSTSALFFYCLSRKSSAVLIGLLTTIFLVLGLLGFSGAGEQVSKRFARLSDVEIINNDERLKHWQQTAPAIREFVPMGSGLGSYLHVHRLYRVDNEKRIFYFAENQYFQTLVETGFLGLIFLLTTILILTGCVRFIGVNGNSPKTSAICSMGAFLIPSQVTAALFDFGLFIPANTVLMATVCGFLAGQSHALADRIERRSILRLNFPKTAVFVLLLFLFSTVLFSFLSTRRYARLEIALGSSPQFENYLSMDEQETDQRIQILKSAIAEVPDADGLLRLAELYVYRYRIQLFNLLTTKTNDDSLLDDPQLNKIWLYSTGLDRLHRIIYTAWNTGDQARINSLIRDPLVRQNLLPAAYYLELSRSRSPLNPAVHALLGQVHSVSNTRGADLPHFERAQSLAPANANIAFVCGIFNLQSQRTDIACKNLAHSLEMDPVNYRKVTSVALAFMPPEQVEERILPDNVNMLHNFAKNQMNSKSLESEQLGVYRRIVRILERSQDWDKSSLVIKSDAEEKLGDVNAAIETQKLLVTLNPNISGYRHRLVSLMLDRCEAMIEKKGSDNFSRSEYKEALVAAKDAFDNLKKRDRSEKNRRRVLKARDRLLKLSNETVELP